MKTQQSQFWGSQLAKALDGIQVEKGGPGSGHYGHSGRKGEVGGSAPGGVLVGRADAPDGEDQFKFSGKATLERAKGEHVYVSVGGKAGGDFEVHGSDKRGMVSVRVGGKVVELDHDELHAVRSKMRFMNEMNKQDVKHIAGKAVARGQSIVVKVGGKSVSIPVNDKSVREIDDAVHHTRDNGYTLAAERRHQIVGAVKAMRVGNPVAVVKKLGFSKAGQLSAFVSHVEHHSDKDLRKLLSRAAAGRGPVAKKFLQNIHAQILEARTQGRAARKALSGTQAVQHYRKAALLVSHLLRK